MASINCRTCGDPRHRVPRNTRYCVRCRLLSELDYWRPPRARTCRGAKCNNRFAPLNRADSHCSTCNPGLQAYHGPCALYPKHPHDGLQVYPQVPICDVCLRHPSRRAWLIAVLLAGRDARRKANNWKEAP